MNASGLARDSLIAAVALIVLLAIQWVYPSGALADFGIRVASMGLFATSLNLMVGYTGLVSFGHGMFFGFGAYSFALLMQRTDISLPLALVGSIVLTVVLAALIGAICIRLRLIYFAFATLAMQMLLHSTILTAQWLTGGDQGLQGGIPRRVFLGLDMGNQWVLYSVSATMLVAGLLIMRIVLASPFGASMRMVRDNEVRAAYLGITVWRVKLTAFVLSAAFAGIGGAIMSMFIGGAYPELANWPQSGQAIFAIMLGGIGSFLGPLAGTVLMLAMNDVFTRMTEYYGLVLGVVILAFALGLRKGLLDFIGDWRTRFAERRESLPPLNAKEHTDAAR